MPRAVKIRGIAASAGIFAGAVVAVDSVRAQPIATRGAKREMAALEGAIAAAIGAILGLSPEPRGEADILEFQIAMLEDPTLTEYARSAIAGGSAAADAWWGAMETHIASLADAGDDVFAARAADLCDIRDRVLRALAGEQERVIPAGAILAGSDLAPSLFLQTDWSRGGAIALAGGSPSSHVAILARARGIPMVTGLGGGWPGDHRRAIVDGAAGLVVAAPDGDTIAAYSARPAPEPEPPLITGPALRRDGSAIAVRINVSAATDLKGLDPDVCDGIGLVRSEFLFGGRTSAPSEDEQFDTYSQILAWAGKKPVIFRTFDAGGDKPLGFLTSGENAGLRGIRLLLARPQIFKTQLRALARAATRGNLSVMLPMVTLPRELAHAGRLLDFSAADLAAEGAACLRPPLGMMVEVPAVALMPEQFKEAAFFAIGTNDLAQFVMATWRSEAAEKDLSDASHPALLKLIANVAAYGAAHGVPVSVCGDLASEPHHLPALLEAGVTELSVPPTSLARVKQAISRL